MTMQQHPGFPPYLVPPPLIRPTSGLAVAALILSLLWGFGIFSVIALVLVMVGWKDTRSGNVGGHGLNVAALVIGGLGLVVPTVMVALAVLSGIGMAAA